MKRPLSRLIDAAGVVSAVRSDPVLPEVGNGDALHTEDAGATRNISTPASLQQLEVVEPQQCWPSEQVQIL